MLGPLRVGTLLATAAARRALRTACVPTAPGAAPAADTARAAARAVESLAGLLHNRAGLAHARGQYGEAETAIRRALAVRAGTSRHAEVLRDEGVLAAVLAAQGRHVEAEHLLHRLVDDWRRLGGDDDHEVARLRHHLAVVAPSRGDLRTAAREDDLALAGMQRVLGGQHPEVIRIRQGREAMATPQQPARSATSR